MTMRPRSAVVLLLVTFAPALAPPAHAESPLGLQQAYRLALRTNPNVAILRERVLEAEAVRSRAWTRLQPTASFQGSFTHYDETIAIDFSAFFPGGLPPSGFPREIVLQFQDQWAFQVGGTLPLFRGPAYPRIAAARTAVDVARLREVRSRQDFLLSVAQAYYLVVTREDVVRALVNKVNVDRQHLAATRMRFDVGQAPRTEVLRAELVATQDEQSLLAQRNLLEAARRALAILVGVPGLPQVERPSTPTAPSSSEAQMVATARSSRADLHAADLSIRVAKKQQDAVWMSFLPSLDLNALYHWNQAKGFAIRRGQWYVMVGLSLPIYDAGRRYADLRLARTRLSEAEQQQQALDLDIKSDLVRLRADVASATAGVVSASKAVTLAGSTLADMESRFRAGTATQLDVLDASQRLLDAELQLTTSLYTRDLSRLALLHAQGRFDPVKGRP